MSESNSYIGEELELFKDATNWKSYWYSRVSSYVGGDVLEVGAGIGANTQLFLKDSKVKSVTSLEPDDELSQVIKTNILNPKLNVVCGNVYDLSTETKFDTILYIDVLEHIESDSAEIIQVKKLLKEGGTLIILVPAHNYLFNEFDKAIGHYRRYNKTMLKGVVNKQLEIQSLKYYDLLGWVSSLVNKWFLKQDYPKKKQIQFWDKVLLPISKILDFIFLHFNGKTLIGIWRK